VTPLAEGFESGAVMYINKPFTANKLLTIVNTMLESRQQPLLGRCRCPARGTEDSSHGSHPRQGPRRSERAGAADELDPRLQGYREKDLRRDADRLQREHLALRLEQGKKALNRIAPTSAAGATSTSSTTWRPRASAWTRWPTASATRSAATAASSTCVKVDETVLARVYQFDMGLVEDVDGVWSAASTAEASPAAQARPAVQDMIGRIDAL